MMLCRLKLLADYMSPFGLSIDLFFLLIGLSGVFDLFSNCLLQCFRDSYRPWTRMSWKSRCCSPTLLYITHPFFFFYFSLFCLFRRIGMSMEDLDHSDTAAPPSTPRCDNQVSLPLLDTPEIFRYQAIIQLSDTESSPWNQDVMSSSDIEMAADKSQEEEDLSSVGCCFC